MSWRYSRGFRPFRRADSIRVKNVAAARPPRSLPANSQFLRLCQALHKRNYAEFAIMRRPLRRKAAGLAA